jgi:geranylgeranyl reductase family protein
MQKMEKFDVIVVGAGTAGCLAAKKVAESGLKTCILERNKKRDIGKKICGDALGEHHFKNLRLEKPQGEELERRIEGVKIFSPDSETVFTIKDVDFVGYILNRHLFGQWLLKKALDKGAVLYDSTMCIEPMIEKKYVTGVSAKKIETGENFELKGKVVLDASGFTAVIRRRLPESMGIENKIANEDVEACYREIRQLKKEDEDSKYCKLFLDQNISPGGYAWIFPKSQSRINTGLGVCMRKGFPNPKRQFNKFILSQPIFKESIKLQGGTWYDPTRRPLDNMVGNGVAILGDAAFLVNPIHGGGIGPSMISGFLAGETVIEALEKDDPSQTQLWDYNCRYIKMYGKKQASLEIFRYLILSNSNEELNYGMKYKVLTEEDILKASLDEDFHLEITETIKRVFRGLKKLGFLNRLRLTAKIMKQVKTHYMNYPKIVKDFPKWKIETEKLFKDARSKIMD